jgi:hypothetical protein
MESKFDPKNLKKEIVEYAKFLGISHNGTKPYNFYKNDFLKYKTI